MKDLYLLPDFRIEVYHYDVPNYGRITWDINRAKEQVKAGYVVSPRPVDVARKEMENIMARCKWTEAHVAEVDVSIPGIAAPFLWEQAIVYVPIDGIHRMVRAYREGKPFSFWLLTNEASRACVIAGPRDRLP